MKLNIVVPHYKEEWNVCKNLFDSIELQQGINFDDVKVIVVNDGFEGVLDEFLFEGYSYTIEYLKMQHGGVSRARNYGIDHAVGDYVMFCDQDDMFLNNYGLHMLFSAMNEGYDLISSVFIEEYKEDDGSYKIVRHEKDITFIHGKAFRLDFLKNKNVRFEDMFIHHEDAYFVAMANMCAESKKQIETPFYLWKWNPNSVVRSNGNLDGVFVAKTYDDLIKVREKLIDEYTERGYIHEASLAIAQMFFDAYYVYQRSPFNDAKYKTYTASAMKEFKRVYHKYKKDFADMNMKDIAEVMMICRTRAYASGLQMESKDFRSWIEEVKKKY